MIRLGAAVGQCVFSSNSLFGLMCVFGSSVRMQVCFLLLLIQLHVTEGCRLEGNGETKLITAYTGDSVLLSCSCTDLHTKPETLTWRKYTNGNNWVEISPEREQYKDRFQLVNDLSSGNFSLLISHLTEEDGGVYMCSLKESEYRDFTLTVKGCTLNRQTVTVTGYVGQSVLLPCSCSELQAKPHTFRWIYIKGTDRIKIFPKDETNRYTDRVQIFNDHLPGNLSLLISHLTVEDGGWYGCEISNNIDTNIRLTVKDAPTRPSASRPVITTTSPNPEPVRMQVCFLLLLIQLHVTEGCRLKGNREIKEITAYTGGSVLLPCSCTDLHTKPETLTWEKYTNDWVEISPESEQYKDRFQLVNDLSSGNFSLLISHLTEEDGGVYRCSLKGSEYRDFRLTVKGCTLNRQTVTVTGYVGQSVLLPCSCSELQAKPHTFRWEFLKDHKEIFPKDDTNRYTTRVQIFNDHLPGNLSLLISHLTVEDGGWYRCEISNTDFKDVLVKFKDAPKQPSTTIRTTSKQDVGERNPESETSGNVPNTDDANTAIIISSGVIGVLLLLLILGGVMYWKRRGQTRGQIETGDGQTGQRTQQKKQDFTKSLNLPVTSEPTYEAGHKQNDCDVLYTTINPQTERNKAEEKDDVTYSTVVHSNTVRAAHTPVESGDNVVYASIKTN
ncbi:polymeric immunoglobulin receptor-like [Ictalurus furcatus]|uniref:polymeric immunoglobulin receptor-like n=1 Tax=Ictalurus furcatus TaxID=66913 RepID=UPI002350D501|nr:polymeric immunoglobulin receptor-like [Ictalurus furcatus]